MVKPGMTENKDRRIAMLIDGDNAQPSLLPKMIAEVGKYGQISIRRIYGDWTTSNMKGWKDMLHNYAVQPIQQFRYTIGKNATDSALIIDAMDILHSARVEGFCIVSSDSDYTRLATRIREGGVFVMGIGEKKTPKSFVNGCDLFVYTDIIATKNSSRSSQGSTSSHSTSERNKNDNAPKKKDLPEKEVMEKDNSDVQDPLPLLTEAFEMAVQENGWANLGQLGKALLQLDPGFDSHTYGHKQLSQMLKSFQNTFELTRLGDEASGVYVKMKEG